MMDVFSPSFNKHLLNAYWWWWSLTMGAGLCQTLTMYFPLTLNKISVKQQGQLFFFDTKDSFFF